MSTTGSARVREHESEWLQAHEALSRLAKQRAAADAEEGRWLLRARRSAAHLHLGFGSFGEYIERLFGYKPRSTQEKLRVAEALEGLPALTHALETGVLGWSAVRELSRVAVAENEREWLDVALGKTLRQLERLVEGKSPGDDPSAPPSPTERRHVLRFEVAAETFALFREAILHLQRRTDAMLDHDDALLLMARHVLGGPAEPGRANYQIALTVCSRCGIGHQQAAGDLVPVGEEVLEQARCDAQHVGQIAMRAANENASTASVAMGPLVDGDAGGVHVDAAPVGTQVDATPVGAQVDATPVGAQVDAAPVGAQVDATPVGAQVDATPIGAHVGTTPFDGHVETTADGAHVRGAPVGAHVMGAPDGAHARATPIGPHLGGVHVGARVGEEEHRSDGAAPPGAARDDVAHAPARAKQTIPPALRRAVLRRDHERCQAPGCKNATFLDLHHIHPRSEGGPNEAENLITLCTVHHRAAHRGELLVAGTAAQARFRHADGSEYGQPARARAIEAQAKVFSALRHLGFRQGEVQEVMAELRSESELREATVERLLREALRRMGPGRVRR